MPRTMKPWTTAAWTLVLLTALGLAHPAMVLAKTEIHFWHAMTGQLGDAVNELVKQFNASQNEYEVKPLRKGTYPETLTAAIAAYRQKNPPHIVQVFEAGTQTMMLSGAVLPVYQLFAEQGFKIDWKEFIAPVVGYYSKDGNLYSMPFNSSTPIFYYNKDVFQKAGLDPSKPPQTWKQVEEYSKKIIASGAAKCGFSTGWPSWTMVENMHAWHDQPFATKRNGIGGVTRGVKFQWGTGQLPFWGPPYTKATSIIGGATLWVMKGKPAAENRGTALFLKFISDANQQMWWHVTTGYLAISNSAVKNLEAGYHFKKSPDQFTAFAQLTNGKATPNSQGLRLGNFVQIRDVIEGEMENIFAGKKTAKQGLDDAAAKSNEMLKEFAAQNKQ